MGVPVRYPNGVSTAPRLTMFGDYPYPTPVVVADLYNDFLTYLAADWTVTASTGTTALAAGNGGRLLQSTAAAGADIQFNTKNPAHAAITAGFPFWFCWMGQSNDNASDVRFGMFTGGTPFAPTDGIFFEKLTAQNNVTFNLKTGGSTTSVALGSGAAMVPATDTSYGFYYDGAPTPTIYVFCSTAGPTASAFGQQRFSGGYLVAALGANSTAGTLLTNLPTSVLSAGFGLRATPAAIKTLNTDYLIASPTINRP